MTEQNTLSAALEYLGRGWSPLALCPYDHEGVSNVHKAMCGTPGKTPLGAWKEYQSRKPTEAEIADWWTRQPVANVGVCMGPVSGIVGLDVDGEEGERLLNEACGEELPDTCEFTTPGGGRRLLFLIPSGVQMPGPSHSFGGAKHSGMSFLSHGSQTVMPPSRHANGGDYAWKEHARPADRPLQTVPAWLMEWARKQNQKVRTLVVPTQGGGDVIPEGARDSTLAQMAGSLRRFGAGKEAIYAALTVENQRRCQPPLPDAQVEKIADSISHYEPSQVNLNRIRVEKYAPRANMVDADSIESRQVEWLWQNWLPLGKLIVLDGDPSLGKSTLLVDIAARISRGDVMPDKTPGIQGKVIIATAEDGLADTLKPRLLAANADCSQITILKDIRDGSKSRPMTLPGDIPAIQAEIRARQAKFFYIDPLMAFLGAGIDSCKDQDVRRCLHALAELAEEENCAILFLRHLNKAPGPKAIYRGGGSIGIIGAARVGMLVAEDPDDESARILACTKNNLAEMPASLKFSLQPTHYHVCRVVWNGTSTADADQLLNRDIQPGAQGKRKSVDLFLKDFLVGGRRPSNDVYEVGKAEGFSRKTLERAKARLNIESVHDGFGDKIVWYWQMPDTFGASQGGSDLTEAA